MAHQSNYILELRYGLNPHQAQAVLKAPTASCPVAVLSGAPSYINVLDALRGWKLVRELRRRFAAPAAASYKHANPAGVGLGRGSFDEIYRRMHFLRDWALSPLATAYLSAHHADRIASYGDFVALSDIVDVETAQVLKNMASDGVIAPGYAAEALSILKGKRNGRFLILAIDPCYEPIGRESRDEFGLILVQDRDTLEVPDPRGAKCVTSDGTLEESTADTLLLAMIVAKHTQSNAVVIATADQTVGIGAGQQSRIAATKIACEKAEAYALYDHPKILSFEFQPALDRIEKINVVEQFLEIDRLGHEQQSLFHAQILQGLSYLSDHERTQWIRGKRPLCLASDAAIPFRDNIDRAARAGVTHVMQTGGSIRDGEVTSAAARYGMMMLHTGTRHFQH
jgi:phosphoribosylaminoimidazolecarboxamide formyltransferase / IMP cyclohydrolase